MTRKQIERQVANATSTAPPSLAAAVLEVATDKSMSDAMQMTMSRTDGFTTPTAAVFAGVALNPAARQMIDRVLDEQFAANRRQVQRGSAPFKVPDVVIGSGPHAAIYAAVKVASGGSRPLVIEREDRAGGVFAVSRGPAFYLNSRNRPGDLAPPGVAGGALNVLPEAPVQAVDLGGAEYQSNDQLAFATRITLALNATVVTGVEAVSLARAYSPQDGYNLPQVALRTDDGLDFVRAERVVAATGLGPANNLAALTVGKSPNVLTFPEFMARLDDPLPFRDFGRVAVLGAGDGGKVVIEALTGQGPRSPVMVPAFGYPTSIEWYGLSDSCYDEDDGRDYDQTTRLGWERTNRSRYRGIGRLLPRELGDDTARVTPREFRATSFVQSYKQLVVNGRPYDTVIDATGYDAQAANELYGEDYSLSIVRRGGRNLYRAEEADEQVVTIGPASQLPLEPYEQQSSPVSVGENTVAIWRYADRTAMVAAETADREVV